MGIRRVGALGAPWQGQRDVANRGPTAAWTPVIRIGAVCEHDDLDEDPLRELNTMPGWVVTCACRSGEEALRQCQPGTTDVFVAGLVLPDLAGADLVRQLKVRAPALPILIWTSVEAPDLILAALRAGASGCLCRQNQTVSLVDGLRQVMSGGSPLDPKVAREVLRVLQQQALDRPGGELSARERAILRTVSEDRSYKEVAAEFGISVNTVHAHMRRIYSKLQVRRRQEAFRYAQQLGILTRW